MPRKKIPTDDTPQLETQLDDLLASTLAAGWSGDVPSIEAPAPTPEPEYPPLPSREWPLPDVRSTAGKKPASLATNEARAQISSLLGLPANLTEDQDATVDEGELPASKRLLNIGMLSQIATGKTTPEQAARTAGVSMDELQQGLAHTLSELDPAEIAKAMGMQAAQEQLKAGALFGAVINDLVADMVNGRLTPQLKLQLAEMLSVIGRVKPKEDKGSGAGGGFVLNIHLDNNKQNPVIIDAD